jgi:CPA1 family monovalent cation:H+ antiporter
VPASRNPLVEDCSPTLKRACFRRVGDGAAIARGGTTEDSGCEAEFQPSLTFGRKKHFGMSSFDLVAFLLLMAAVLGLLNERWIGWPPTIGLLIGALGLSLMVLLGSSLFPREDVIGVARTMLVAVNLPRVLLDGALAFLLFAASLHVDLNALRANKWTILALATGGVMLSTLVFGALIWSAFQATNVPVPINWCFTIAAVLAPTDAVAVDAVLRRVDLPRSVKAAISGESLFNDGVGVVIFLVALASAQGARGLVGHGAVALALVSQGFGGMAVGVATGALAAAAMRVAKSFNLELTISLALVLGTYRVADAFGVSGPIAVVASGLLVGNISDWRGVEAAERPTLILFWSLVDELLNALLFLLIGFEVLALDPRQVRVLPILASIPFAIIARAVSVGIARAVSVGIPVMLLNQQGRSRGRTIGVLTWTGLRGGVSVALGLTLEGTPYFEQLLTVCYTVVVFTIIVQGMSMPAALRLLAPPEQRPGDT